MRQAWTGLFVALVISGVGVSITATADDGPPSPPQEAMDACGQLSDGASCSFQHDGQTITGTCHGPQGKPLACMPKGCPMGPPPEAIQACQGLDVGAACSVELRGRTYKGTCRGPDGKPPACMPDDMPPPPQR